MRALLTPLTTKELPGMGKEVLILSRKFREQSDYAREFLETRGCTIAERSFEYPVTEDALIEVIPDVDGLITGLELITPRVFAAANRLKVVSAGGVGYDHIDVAEANRRGVAVCICEGCNNYSVSELVFGMMVGLARGIYPADRALREGEWTRYLGFDLWGKTLGIVGLGRVGKAVALLGRAFGMRVLANDVSWDITFANQNGISYVPFERILDESDFVTMHVPLTPETREMIDEAALARMKPSAYLINAARGPVVKESALVEALRTRQIAGAGLDVFEVEPHPSNPYIDLDNVIMTPHVGGSTQEAFDRAFYLALVNVSNVLNGLPAHCQVNRY
jgi:D-3-phosphoglycerate dehydrogenase